MGKDIGEKFHQFEEQNEEKRTVFVVIQKIQIYIKIE